MTRRIGACVVMLLWVGCGVGGGDDDPVDPDPIDPNPNKLTCSDAFKINGTFAESTPRPPDVAGCWPVGSWTFTVSRDPAQDNVLDITGDQQPDRCGSVSGTQAATFDANFAFIVEHVTDPENPDDTVETYRLEGQTVAGDRTQWNGKLVDKMKVTEGGGGDCTGGIELRSTDGMQYWNMRPSLDGTTLTGVGGYAAYQVPQL